MSAYIRSIGACEGSLCTCVCLVRKQGIASSCPDPLVNRLTSIPRSLWALLSWHDEHACQLAANNDSVAVDNLVKREGALEWYTHPIKANYRQLNGLLRDGFLAFGADKISDKSFEFVTGGKEFVRKVVMIMDDLIELSPPVQEPGLVVWRGFSSFRQVYNMVHQRDTKVSDLAYSSCSIERSMGNFYARRHAILLEDLDDALLLRIDVPVGAKVLCAACLPRWARVHGEEEIILPRGSTLVIDRVVPREPGHHGGIHYVEAHLSNLV